MAQSSDESKMNKGPIAISRDFVPRDFKNEKPLLAKSSPAEKISNIEKAETAPVIVNRRDFFKSVVPASGKALTGILRNFQWTLSTFIEDSKNKK